VSIPHSVITDFFLFSLPATVGGVPDSLLTPTTSGGVQVSALIELQSTSRALLLSRMTEAQRDALTAVNGLTLYNTTSDTLDVYAGGVWTHLNEAGGDITVDSIENGAGLIGAPSYTFTGDTDTGMWHSAANTIDFSTNALRTLQLGAAPAVSVNYLVVTPQATNAGNAALQPKIAAAGTDAVVDVAIEGKGATSGLAVLPTTTGAAGSIKLWNPAGTFFTKIQAGTNLASLTLTAPIADASANASATATFVPLSSNTAGALSFANQGVRYSERTLSAANIAGMFANGVEVIPAPGANLAVIVHAMEFQLFFDTAAYTAGGNVYLNYGALGAGTNYATTSNGIPAAFVTGVAANSSFISVTGTINSTTGLTAGSVVNAAVCITNSAGAFATGAGTARVKVWYSIVATT
jgi:hypothetical protein